jgi:transposase-like protein
VWNWTHDLAEAQVEPPTAEPSRVAIGEKQIEGDGDEKWLYAAIDTESKLLLEIDVYSRPQNAERFDVRTRREASRQRCGTDPAAASLHRVTQKHDVSDVEFLVDVGGYLTARFRHDLSGQLNYTERNHVEKWFQTVSMQIDRFHSSWRGSQSST